eukprot:Rmarinus@m.11075
MSALRIGKLHTALKFCPSRVSTFAKRFALLRVILETLLSGKTVSLRELYYRLLSHFSSPAEVNDTVVQVTHMFGCTRRSLGVVSSSIHGFVVGACAVTWCAGELSCEEIPCDVTCTNIPDVDPTHVHVRSLGARFVLVVEKDAVFQTLHRKRFYVDYPSIIVTGCGFPPVCVRSFVRCLSDQLSLPVFVLTDFDPHGFGIFLTYKRGSYRMALESCKYVVDVEWLGLHSDDIQVFGIPHTMALPFTKHDHRFLRHVLSCPLVRSTPFYLREAEHLERTCVKYEIESLCAVSEETLCRHYLPRKLSATLSHQPRRAATTPPTRSSCSPAPASLALLPHDGNPSQETNSPPDGAMDVSSPRGRAALSSLKTRSLPDSMFDSYSPRGRATLSLPETYSPKEVNSSQETASISPQDITSYSSQHSISSQQTASYSTQDTLTS